MVCDFSDLSPDQTFSSLPCIASLNSGFLHLFLVISLSHSVCQAGEHLCDPAVSDAHMVFQPIPVTGLCPAGEDSYLYLPSSRHYKFCVNPMSTSFALLGMHGRTEA